MLLGTATPIERTLWRVSEAPVISYCGPARLWMIASSPARSRPLNTPTMQPRALLLGPVWLAVLLAAEPCRAADAALTYTTPTKVSLTVTADGLSSIHSGDRDLAAGSWSAFNA